MAPLTVVPYDPHWPMIFERLRAAVWPAVADLATSIEHVGSTSVPGLAAKPIIDLDIVLRDPAHVATAIARLAALGYVHRGDLGIEGREAFHAPDGTPAHHLYVCRADAASLLNHLALRDHLRRNPERAAAYGRLKQRLALEYPEDPERYGAAKTDAIIALLREAGVPEALLDGIARANGR